MKIIGFVNSNESPKPGAGSRNWVMVLKGDSCLLNGRKPLFVPDWTNELGVTECLILRVSRLGKEIAPRFANRYYDAVAPGADFVAMDLLREAQSTGKPWTEALAFDYSLAIGEWDEEYPSSGHQQSGLLLTPDEAIAAASRVMTIRQGDLIYIQRAQAPRLVQKEEIIRVEKDGKDKLYCKIK